MSLYSHIGVRRRTELAGVGDWVGPLIFLGIAGYGVYAYTQMKWPFDGSIMLPSLGGAPADMTGGLPGGGGTGTNCMGNPCDCTLAGMEGVVAYATALELAKRSSKSGGGSSTMPSSMMMLPGAPLSTTPTPMVAADASCPCDCSGAGGAGAGGLPSDGGLGGGGGGGGGGGKKSKGHHTKKKTSKHSKKGTGHKKSHYATYGDYGRSGALISAGVATQDYTSGFAKYGDYGHIGNLISAEADPFRTSYYASYGDYGPVGALINQPILPPDYSAYESNYTPEDAYYPVQLGYSGQFIQSGTNYRAGFLPQVSNRNPLAEYTDRGVPVAVS